MKNIEQWLKERQIIYSIMSLIYRGDLKIGLEILNNTSMLINFSIYSENLQISKVAKEVIEEIEDHQDNDAYLKLLYEDYNALFVGPNDLLAPLWESVYRSNDRLLFGDSELEVRNLYSSIGLSVTPREPADSLALELSFISRLCELEINYFSNDILTNLLIQQNFLKDHLLNWVPSWADDVCKFSKTKFWSGFAIVTKSFLIDDFNRVEEILLLSNN